MWKESVKEQINSLERILVDNSIEDTVKQMVNVIFSCKGICYFTGVGKNMYVASRVASTYDSLGIRSIFVDPVHTLHGSMGIFSERDIVIAISKSGNTSELIAFVLALRKQGFTNIIGVTANKKSQLCNLSNLCLAVDIANEGDQFNLAPIASTMIFGSLLDSIAVEISFSKGYTKEDFIRNHPGGELGKTRV